MPISKETTGVFPVIRLTNGAGHSNLMIVTEEAIPDVFIGSVLLVPVAQGYKDPTQVRVIIDDGGRPVATNLRTCIVAEYIYK